MNQQECFKRLGFEREGDSSVEVSIESMECAIVQSIDSRLASSADEIEEFKPCLFDSQYLLLKRGHELLFIDASEEGFLYVSGCASELFSALRYDDLLHRILDGPIIAELQRLSAQAERDREAEAKERRRAKFEELRLEFWDELDESRKGEAQ